MESSTTEYEPIKDAMRAAIRRPWIVLIFIAMLPMLVVGTNGISGPEYRTQALLYVSPEVSAELVASVITNNGSAQSAAVDVDLVRIVGMGQTKERAIHSAETGIAAAMRVPGAVFPSWDERMLADIVRVISAPERASPVPAPPILPKVIISGFGGIVIGILAAWGIDALLAMRRRERATQPSS